MTRARHLNDSDLNDSDLNDSNASEHQEEKP